MLGGDKESNRKGQCTCESVHGGLCAHVNKQQKAAFQVLLLSLTEAGGSLEAELLLSQ